MGRLIAGARKKKNISLEELSQGVMSAEDLNFIEKDDEYADKTTWDFLLGRLGISPLIYECYVEQEEYDLFKEMCIRDRINEMDKWEGSQLNKAKEILAFELTNQMCIRDSGCSIRMHQR